MYGVIGEARSDAQTLAVFVSRLSALENNQIKRKGFGGCGEMLNRGAKQLIVFRDLGCTRFVVAYDSDGQNPETRAALVAERIVIPSGLKDVCVLIPIQEIEAWILADLPAVTNIIPSWTPKELNRNPETVSNAKEFLANLSNRENKKPRYSHATHNERVAWHIDLVKVYSRCSSFRPLKHFISGV